MSLWSVLPIWSLLLFFSTFYRSDSSLQGEAGKHQLSVLAFLTSSVQWRQHKAATWRGRTDPEAALVLHKRQLGIRDASAPYHQSMPMGNIKSQLLLKFLAWSAHLIAKLNPQARACISKLSCHVLMQIKHVFSLGHCQRESRNNPETLWPQSLGNLPVTYLWGWKNQTRKGSKPVSSDWRNLLTRLHRFNKSKKTAADVLEIAQSFQHWWLCKHQVSIFLHCFSEHVFLNSISTR